MNKKFISLFTTAALASSMATALAANPEVNVVVNGATVNFADQKAVIVNDRTLIPARGAFEAMGCTVEWDGEKREVLVKNDRNTKKATLTIDSDKMIVQTYTSLFDVTTEEITLDVPAQIMSDRTMIPLRAVGEAMGAVVAWDGDTYTASITTAEGEKLEEKKEQLATESTEETTDATEEPKDAEDTEAPEETTDDTEEPEATEAPVATADFLSLSLSEAEATAEDEVVVSVDIAGMDLYPDHYVSGITLALEYDKTVLELVGAKMVNGDAVIEDSLGVDNADFSDSSLKVAHVTINRDNAAKADGSIMKITFKVLKDEACDVSISTGYNTTFGYDTLIGLDNAEDETVEFFGTGLVIDETPLVVND